MEFQAGKVYRCAEEFVTTGDFRLYWLYISPEDGVLLDGRGQRFRFNNKKGYFELDPAWGIIKCRKNVYDGHERQFTAGRSYPARTTDYGKTIIIQSEFGFEQAWPRNKAEEHFNITKPDMEIMEITEKDLRGGIKDFPLEVVKAMLRRQQEQKGKSDIQVFQRDCRYNKNGGGFDWELTPEGYRFWDRVIRLEDFNLFSTGYKGDQTSTKGEDEKEAPLKNEVKSDTGINEKRVSEIANRVSNEVYTARREQEMPLKDQLAELGIHPTPVTVEVKAPKKETKKVDNQHFLFPHVLKCLVARVNVALVGPAGSGKTSMVHNAANALDLPFYSKSVSAQTGVHEFFGYQDANGKFVRTLFREAYEKGGVFLVDEFDAGNPNVLAALNQATANGSCAFPDKMVDKHKDFIAVMAGNTFGTGATAEYVGRNKIDAATLDRFVFIEVPYDETLEMALATDKEWCRKVQQFRAQAEKKKVKCIISPRATFNGQAMLAAGMEEDFVLKTTVFKGLSEDEIRLLEEAKKSKEPTIRVSGEVTWEPSASDTDHAFRKYLSWVKEKGLRREWT